MIRVNFNREAMKAKLMEAHKTFVQLTVANMGRIGEQFIKTARQNGTYTDRTGNLRSSIGYVVLYNGELMKQAFQQADRGTDRAKGVQQAKTFAAELAQKFPKGIVLIVVAGMEYAVYVEKTGREVLSGSATTIKSDVQAAAERIKQKLSR